MIGTRTPRLLVVIIGRTPPGGTGLDDEPALIKAAVDPANVFHRNANMVPAT